MDLDLPADDDPRRLVVRDWFEQHPTPTPRELVDAGYVVPHWPRPWGLDAEPELQLIIEGEMKRAGVTKPLNPIGIGHCGPTLVALANEEQQRRYLWPMLTGEELWCQLFSEPGSGSDLANLSTRADRDGDVYIVNGQKTWTSLAQNAKFGILIARTNVDVVKYRGISYFIIPMDLPGIEVRPIRNMADDGLFNDVFFTDVRVPVENLIGEENLGWGMAKGTLANERVTLSTGAGLQWGYGPSARDLIDQVAAHGGTRDLVLRQKLASVFSEGEILRYHRMRMISAAVNKKPGPDASLRKALADIHGQRAFRLAKEVMGASGMLADGGDRADEWAPWQHGFLFSPALTVGGGTSEVLRNVIGERLLGLPHDADVETGRTWREVHSAAPALKQ
jgi:alkylation response protein AidB-like acyl-CoA dehydrogenase